MALAFPEKGESLSAETQLPRCRCRKHRRRRPDLQAEIDKTGPHVTWAAPWRPHTNLRRSSRRMGSYHRRLV